LHCAMEHEPKFRPRRRISSVIGQGGRSKSLPTSSSKKLGSGEMHMSPSEVDEAWQALLQETLSEDKQEALMESYEQEKDPSMRYNMLLEFSSYLRQSQAGPSGDSASYGPGVEAQQRRQHMAYDDNDDTSLCWEITRVLLIVMAVVMAVVGTSLYLSGTFDDMAGDAGTRLGEDDVETEL